MTFAKWMTGFLLLVVSAGFAVDQELKLRSPYDNLERILNSGGNVWKSKLPHPYCDLEEILPYDPHGWYQNAEPMQALIQTAHPKIVVEIGSWLGQSTRHIATLLPTDGKVYAVDHWLGSVEHQPGNSAWHPALPRLYEQFLSNVIHAKLTDKIIPVRMSSLEAASELKVVPDLVYIDGAHDYESVYNDLAAWYPFVKGHGILCGDDWLWDTTRAAVEQFAKDNQLGIQVTHNFWCYVQE